MLTVYNVYRMQQWRSIMYSIDKCVGIPDLSKHAAVPKREGGGMRQAIWNVLIICTPSQMQMDRGRGGDNMKLKLTQLTEKKQLWEWCQLITVGKTSPAFCHEQLLHSRNTRTVNKTEKQGTYSNKEWGRRRYAAHTIGKCAKTKKLWRWSSKDVQYKNIKKKFYLCKIAAALPGKKGKAGFQH